MQQRLFKEGVQNLFYTARENLFSSADEYESQSNNNSNTTQRRRKVNRFRLLLRDLDIADFSDFFLGAVRVTAIGEDADAADDE